MRVDMVLGLRDVPGMLVRALEPVSAGGGNIVSVLHSRGKRDVVEVSVIFKVRDQKTLTRILGALKKEGIHVVDVKVEGRKYFKKLSVSFILIGHVIDQDIQDTIDRINEAALVRDVDVRMTDPEKESSVLLEVDVDEDKLEDMMERVKVICEGKKFMFIREVTS